MRVRETSAWSREFGATLRGYRQAAGYRHAQDLARKLGWEQSKISRLETGIRGASETDIIIYLVACGVLGDELDELLEMQRTADDNYWIRPHNQQLPDGLRSLIVQESAAKVITAYEPLLVPGLLQTEDYARALLHDGGVMAQDKIEPAVKARMDRQQVLRQMWPPQATFYIRERALREPVGDARIMNEQLLHLLFLADMPQYTVRVIPLSTKTHTGIPFAMLENPAHKPVVAVDTHTTTLLLEKPADITVYRAILGKLADVALSEGQSRELFASLANEYDHPGDEHHAYAGAHGR